MKQREEDGDANEAGELFDQRHEGRYLLTARDKVEVLVKEQGRRSGREEEIGKKPVPGFRTIQGEGADGHVQHRIMSQMSHFGPAFQQA